MKTPGRSRGYFLWADLFRGRKDPKKGTLIQALKESALFCTLSETELKELAHLVYERSYEAGEAVFRQGDRGFGLYLVVKGRVAIRSRTEAGEVLVTTLGPGSFFGELSLIEEDNVRSATALPLEACSLIGFFKSDLLEILSRRPQTGVKILLQLSMVLGKRLLETTLRIPEGQPEPTEARDGHAA